MMSAVFSPYTLMDALVASEDILGPERLWHHTNSDQARFLETYYDSHRQDVHLIPELESVASYHLGEINDFLRHHDFTIQLRPPVDFGMASVLDVNVAWLLPGRKTKVRTESRELYPAAYLPPRGVQFVQLEEHPNLVVQLTTQTEDVLYLTMLDEYPDTFELIPTIQSFSHQNPQYVQNSLYAGVIFPMVDLDMEVETAWLAGLHTKGEDGITAVVTQALQQFKFKMNERGARIQNAAGMGVTRGGPRPYIINRSFLVWVERPTLALPLFAAYITPQDWREPRKL